MVARSVNSRWFLAPATIKKGSPLGGLLVGVVNEPTGS